MKKYYSELNIQDDGNVAIATVTADNNEQVTFKVVNAKTVYAVDNTENDRNCIYHLLTNEAGKYMPFYQRPGFCAETETIQIEENFDDFEILSSRCACGYKKDFVLNSVILKKGDSWSHWMGGSVTDMGKKIAPRAYYNEEKSELTLFTAYPYTISRVSKVVANDGVVEFDRDGVHYAKVWQNQTWIDIWH